jgi:hypothetical protein
MPHDLVVEVPVDAAVGVDGRDDRHVPAGTGSRLAVDGQVSRHRIAALAVPGR